MVSKIIIYGILFLAILFAWQWGLERNRNVKNVKEGFAKANPNLAKTDTVTVKPDPEPNPADAALKSKNASKLSACGDTCDTYDNIKTALESFKKLKDKQQTSSAAISKVDKDIIKLSESVKNMGNSKVPGGRPVVTKEML
jgi:hypothetical protein